MHKKLIALRVNGQDQALEVWPMQRLIDVLRQNLKCTGVKEGCGEGECGSCSVLMDGELVNSCLVPVCQAEGSSITTIEGLVGPKELHPVQQAFIAGGGTQCGFCTPGMIMAVVSLLQTNANPGEDEIRKGIAGNLCRCTGYTGIIASVKKLIAAVQHVSHESIG